MAYVCVFFFHVYFHFFYDLESKKKKRINLPNQLNKIFYRITYDPKYSENRNWIPNETVSKKKTQKIYEPLYNQYLLSYVSKIKLKIHQVRNRN